MRKLISVGIVVGIFCGQGALAFSFQDLRDALENNIRGLFESEEKVESIEIDPDILGVPIDTAIEKAQISPKKITEDEKDNLFSKSAQRQKCLSYLDELRPSEHIGRWDPQIWGWDARMSSKKGIMPWSEVEDTFHCDIWFIRDKEEFYNDAKAIKIYHAVERIRKKLAAEDISDAERLLGKSKTFVSPYRSAFHSSPKAEATFTFSIKRVAAPPYLKLTGTYIDSREAQPDPESGEKEDFQTYKLEPVQVPFSWYKEDEKGNRLPPDIKRYKLEGYWEEYDANVVSWISRPDIWRESDRYKRYEAIEKDGVFGLKIPLDWSLQHETEYKEHGQGYLIVFDEPVSFELTEEMKTKEWQNQHWPQIPEDKRPKDKFKPSDVWWINKYRISVQHGRREKRNFNFSPTEELPLPLYHTGSPTYVRAEFIDDELAQQALSATGGEKENCAPTGCEVPLVKYEAQYLNYIPLVTDESLNRGAKLIKELDRFVQLVVRDGEGGTINVLNNDGEKVGTLSTEDDTYGTVLEDIDGQIAAVRDELTTLAEKLRHIDSNFTVMVQIWINQNILSDHDLYIPHQALSALLVSIGQMEIPERMMNHIRNEYQEYQTLIKTSELPKLEKGKKETILDLAPPSGELLFRFASARGKRWRYTPQLKERAREQLMHLQAITFTDDETREEFFEQPRVLLNLLTLEKKPSEVSEEEREALKAEHMAALESLENTVGRFGMTISEYLIKEIIKDERKYDDDVIRRMIEVLGKTRYPLLVMRAIKDVQKKQEDNRTIKDWIGNVLDGAIPGSKTEETQAQHEEEKKEAEQEDCDPNEPVEEGEVPCEKPGDLNIWDPVEENKDLGHTEIEARNALVLFAQHPELLSTELRKASLDALAERQKLYLNADGKTYFYHRPLFELVRLAIGEFELFDGQGFSEFKVTPEISDYAKEKVKEMGKEELIDGIREMREIMETPPGFTNWMLGGEKN